MGDLIAESSEAFFGPYWFGAVKSTSGRLQGCGIHAKPDGLVLTDIPESAIDDIFLSIDGAIGAPHRIMAPDEVAKSLAYLWEEKRGMRPYLHSRWNQFRVDTVVRPESPSDGRLRKGTEHDRDFVRTWGVAYGNEKPAPVNVAEFMLRKLRQGELFFWEDDEPKTMITLSGPTNTGIRISSVFTPQDQRGKGYASTAVANLSDNLLRKGRTFVTLTTQKDDPAERVYRRLGFNLIGSRSCYLLTPLLSEMN